MTPITLRWMRYVSDTAVLLPITTEILETHIFKNLNSHLKFEGKIQWNVAGHQCHRFVTSACAREVQMTLLCSPAQAQPARWLARIIPKLANTPLSLWDMTATTIANCKRLHVLNCHAPVISALDEKSDRGGCKWLKNARHSLFCMNEWALCVTGDLTLSKSALLSTLIV